jgi:hypothetical protein
MAKLCGGVAVLLVSLVLLGGSAGAAGPGAGSHVKTHYCGGTLHFFDSPYGFISRGVNCVFARYWTVHYQRLGKHPRHWVCTGRGSYTEGGTCWDRRSKASFEYYIED